MAALEKYDPTITRVVGGDFQLPYTCGELEIRPNEFAFAPEINRSISRIWDNLEYLKSQTKIYNSVIPISRDNWDGDLLEATNIKSMAAYGDQLWLIDDGVIRAYNSSSTLTEIAIIDKSDIGDFLNLKSLTFDVNGILHVLDGYLIYQFDVSDLNDIKFLAYYGGYGGASVTTKFNEPSIIHIDNNRRIHISDFGNSVTKIYNQNFGHLKTIPIKTVSITSDELYTYYLLEDGNVQKRDLGHGLEDSFYIGGTGIYHDPNQPGFIYSISDSLIKKFTIAGIQVGVFRDPTTENKFVGVAKQPSLDTDTNFILIADQNNIARALDHSFSLTIRSDAIDPHPLSSILFDLDEPISDIYYNDTFKKLEENLNTFTNSVTGKFNNSLGASRDIILSQEVSALSGNFENCIISKIPQNYIYSRNTIITPIKHICECFERIQTEVLLFTTSRSENNIDQNSLCWSIESLKCSEPQFKNDQVNPITLQEIKCHPVLSCHPMTADCCANNQPLFDCESTNVSGDLYRISLQRVSGSELYSDDELNYVWWSEDVCLYSNDRVFSVEFPNTGTMEIFYHVQDPAYQFIQGSCEVIIS